MSGHVTEMAGLIEFRSGLYGCLTGWRDALRVERWGRVVTGTG